MKKLVAASLLLAVPMVVSALLASVTYAYDRFTDGPQPVHADGAGVDKATECYAMTTLHDGDVEYLVVSTYGPYDGDKEEDRGIPRHFLTFYEIIRKQDGVAELKLVGSRCVEWDRGFELLGFKPDNSQPSTLKSKHR